MSYPELDIIFQSISVIGHVVDIVSYFNDYMD